MVVMPKAQPDQKEVITPAPTTPAPSGLEEETTHTALLGLRGTFPADTPYGAPDDMVIVTESGCNDRVRWGGQYPCWWLEQLAPHPVPAIRDPPMTTRRWPLRENANRTDTLIVCVS